MNKINTENVAELFILCEQYQQRTMCRGAQLRLEKHEPETVEYFNKKILEAYLALEAAVDVMKEATDDWVKSGYKI